MADTKKTEKKFSTYKGRPLVRCNDEIYYGSMEEPYVIRMQIKSKKDVNGTEIADKVTVQDRKSTRLNSSHITRSRMPSSA